MNYDIIQGNWDQFKGALRQKWGKLTDQDLETLKGKREELEGVLQAKLGMKKEEFQDQFKALSESFEKKFGQASTVRH